MRSLAYSHRYAVALSLVCGLIYVAPQLAFRHSLGTGYQGVLFSAQDAEVHSLVIANEVGQGFFSHASPFLYEYKDESAPQTEYAEAVYAFLAKAMRLSVPAYFLAAKLFAPMVMFLLWYAFSFLVTKSKRSAMLSGLLLMFGYYILSNASIAKQLGILLWQTTSVPLLAYGRFVNPLLTYPFFFVGLICAYQLFSENTRKAAVRFGVALGVLFYVYFYFWAYLLALSFVMMLFATYRKEWELMKNTALGILIALALGSYFIAGMVPVAFGSVSAQTGGATSPFVPSHSPVFPNLVVLGIILLGVFAYLKRRGGEAMTRGEQFLFLLLATAVVTVNQQVLSGRAIEPGHFHWFTSIPVFFLVASYAGAGVLERVKSRYLRQALYLLACAYLIAFGVGTQVSGYRQSHDTFAYYQNYGVIFDWLNAHTPPESVVFGGEAFSDLVPAYTYDNVYFAPHAVYDPINPLPRRIHTAYLYYFLDGNREGVLRKIYPFTVLGSCTSTGCADSDLFKKTMEGYDAFLKTPFSGNLERYKVDYVVWDAHTDPSWDLGRFGFLKPMYWYGSITVYQVSYP